MDSDEPKERKRSCTDVFSLILFVAFIIGLIILLLYCVVYGDIYRVINGYDQCGNVCGYPNVRVVDKDFQCETRDLVLKPFLLIRNVTASDIKNGVLKMECVSNCSNYAGYRTFLNRCVPEKSEEIVSTFLSKTGLNNFFQEAAEDLHLCSTEVLYLCLISLVFSITLMVLFRYFVGIVVWVLLIGVTIASVAGTIYLWIIYTTANNSNGLQTLDRVSDIDARNESVYLALAIVATIVTVIITLIILITRKRIQLVVSLFKEAGKAISSMPIIILEPLLTFTCLAVLGILWVYFCLWIQSAGILTFREINDYFYKKDFTIKLTRWYNLLAFICMVQFVIGCQHMVIAGAISSWYFTRNKSVLKNAILKSFHNLVRYHLGSVALGSFIIALVQFLRVILGCIQFYLKNHTGECFQYVTTCCQCCLGCFEKVLKYLTRNAYIRVAAHGDNFCKGGQKAFQLLVSNAVRVTVINSVGDFVLFLGKVLVVMSTVLIGVEILKDKEGIQHLWIPLSMAGVFAYFISHCFITVYEMAIDTIFLCFCEDCEENDGISKPFYMSRDLMEYVENSKKVIAYLDKTNTSTSHAWGASILPRNVETEPKY